MRIEKREATCAQDVASRPLRSRSRYGRLSLVRRKAKDSGGSQKRGPQNVSVARWFTFRTQTEPERHTHTPYLTGGVCIQGSHKGQSHPQSARAYLAQNKQLQLHAPISREGTTMWLIIAKATHLRLTWPNHATRSRAHLHPSGFAAVAAAE